MKKILFLISGFIAASSGLAQNNAGVLSITAPTAVATGATFSATMVMTNTGTTPWTTADFYRLGAEFPRDNVTWSTANRLDLPASPVNPGETATFTSTFTAPPTPGIYPFAWGMVQDGVEWFGRVASKSINVGVDTQFRPGDLVLMQAGNGFTPIAASGTPIFLNNFSLVSNTTTFQLSLPTAGSNALITGSSAFTGMIDLSTDRRYIVVGGYNTNLPYSSSVEAAAIVPRAAGTVDAAGNFVFAVSTTTNFLSGTFRGVVSDGLGNFWAGAQNSGIQYLGTNAPSRQISSLGTGPGTGAIRDLIMVNGVPYFSTSQFPSPGNYGVAAFPSASMTPVEPVLVIDIGPAVIAGTGNPNPKGFYINTNLTIAYVADMRSAANGGGLHRFNGNGSGTNGSWTYAYTLVNDLSAEAFQEVLADFSGTNPRIYAIAGTTAGNSLITTIDTGASSTFTLLQNAPALTAYRGLTFAPRSAPATPVFLTINRSMTNVILSWTGLGILQSAGTVTGAYVNVPGSPASPFTNPIAGTNQFFRLRIP